MDSASTAPRKCTMFGMNCHLYSRDLCVPTGSGWQTQLSISSCKACRYTINSGRGTLHVLMPCGTTAHMWTQAHQPVPRRWTSSTAQLLSYG